jgi:hypothetical protein
MDRNQQDMLAKIIWYAIGGVVAFYVLMPLLPYIVAILAIVGAGYLYRGPEERGADAVLFQQLQETRCAVFNAFVERSERANVGLHVETEHDVESGSRALRRLSLAFPLAHGVQSSQNRVSIFLLKGTGPFAVIS